MKGLLLNSLLLFVALLAWHCESDEEASNIKEIHITLKNTEIYRRYLNVSGDEESAKIVTPPQHDAFNMLIRDSTTNWGVVYQYKAEENYVGPDYVEIETCTGGQGVSCSNIEMVRIRFSITE